MNCSRCGAWVEPEENFCNKCGQRVVNNNGYAPRQNKSNAPFMVFMVIAVVALVAAAGIIGYLISDNSDEKVVNNVESTTTAPTEAPESEAGDTSETVVITAQSDSNQQSTQQTNSNVVYRVSSYSPYLTYKRMSGIHNTSPASDDVYLQISNVIKTFDSQCEAYMNGTSSSVPGHLLPGTTAYNQQVKYKKNHPTLTQKYQSVVVSDARYGGGYYYAWVAETMTKTEYGVTKTVIEDWVYKLQNINGAWYIVDYTDDPAR